MRSKLIGAALNRDTSVVPLCSAGLQLDAWSIPIWVAGVVWLLFGWQLLRWALPAIAFLWQNVVGAVTVVVVGLVISSFSKSTPDSAAHTARNLPHER